MIRAGELRYRVPISAPTKSKDAEGVVTAEPGAAPIASIWVNMQPGGGEYVHRKFGISDEGISMIIKSWPHPAVDEMNRVTFQGHEYEIRHVDRQPAEYTALLRRL